jgi:hypothetical protein
VAHERGEAAECREQHAALAQPRHRLDLERMRREQRRRRERGHAPTPPPTPARRNSARASA